MDHDANYKPRAFDFFEHGGESTTSYGDRTWGTSGFDFATDDLDVLFGALPTKALGEEYADETKDASDFRGEASTWTRHAPPKVAYSEVVTHYLDEAEQAASTIQFGEDGLLVDSQGLPMDTTSATGTGTFNTEGAGKHIFAMTPERSLRAVDPWAGRRDEPIGAEEEEDEEEDLGPSPFDPSKIESYTLPGEEGGITAYKETVASAHEEEEEAPEARRLRLLNHSSLVAGGRVAGAGELRIEQGKLQQVTDQSGHYKPDAIMMHNTLETFAQNGVDMRDVVAKYSKKSGLTRPVLAPAVEALSYGGAADTAQQIRGKRDALATELEQAVAARSSRIASTPTVDPRARRAPKPGAGRTQDLIKLFEGMY